MTTVTLRFQSTGQVPGDGRPVTMRGPSLTLGRGPGNDMVLPDPDRVVSSSHAVIENHNGNVVVVDLSSNGTFLNYGKIPLGRTPTPLNAGDVLTIGPYEIVVEMSRPQQMIADPLDDGPIGHGRAERAAAYSDILDAPDRGSDFLDDLLGGPPPTGPKQFAAEPEDVFGSDDSFDSLLGGSGYQPAPNMMGESNHGASDLYRAPRAAAGVIPDDWDDPLFGSGPSAAAPPPAAPGWGAPPPAAPPVGEFSISGGAEPQSDPFDFGEATPAPPADPFGDETAPAAPSSLAPAPLPASAPEAPAQMVGGAGPISPNDAETARAFLRALGADEAVKDEDLHATMVRLGGVLRAMIVGIREVLMTRTHFKGEFRIDQTMIAASGNNPLKFSITPEQAIEVLTKQSAKGYLSPQEATDQALKDIRAHEVAMISGMEAALKGVLARLDPKLLEEKLDKQGGAGFFTNKRAKYWDLYQEMYAEISDQAENQFHDLFAREFSAAYKSQLERLK